MVKIPQFLTSISFQGVLFDTTTGVPQARASAITIPKLSNSEARVKTSQLLKSNFLSSKLIDPIKKTESNKFSFLIWENKASLTPSSAPAISSFAFILSWINKEKASIKTLNPFI